MIENKVKNTKTTNFYFSKQESWIYNKKNCKIWEDRSRICLFLLYREQALVQCIGIVYERKQQVFSSPFLRETFAS